MSDNHSFVLSCCSTADLSKDHFETRDIHYICFHYFLDGKEYPDDLGQSIPFHDFYQAMVNGAETKTSQVSIGEFTAYFRPFLEEGKDILHVTLSTGISGVYNSATSAAEILREEFPDRKIYIVDSLGASSGYGLLMDHLADLPAILKRISLQPAARTADHRLQVITVTEGSALNHRARLDQDTL